jgi:hypothetical protein
MSTTECFHKAAISLLQDPSTALLRIAIPHSYVLLLLVALAFERIPIRNHVANKKIVENFGALILFDLLMQQQFGLIIFKFALITKTDFQC